MRHKHADVIHAWAEGEEIQYRTGTDWFEFIGAQPSFCFYDWRIKPKIVKREGWVAIFNNRRDDLPSCCGIYRTEEACREVNGPVAKVVRIEWEEEA